MALKGRHWVLFWLGVFLAVAAVIVWRQPRAIASARRLRELRVERAALEAQAADLERRIREASSRAALVRRAESQLGLHEPSDSEYVLFPLPERR